MSKSRTAIAAAAHWGVAKGCALGNIVPDRNAFRADDGLAAFAAHVLTGETAQ